MGKISLKCCRLFEELPYPPNKTNKYGTSFTNFMIFLVFIRYNEKRKKEKNRRKSNYLPPSHCTEACPEPHMSI